MLFYVDKGAPEILRFVICFLLILSDTQMSIK